jgi:hypothetical protein
MLQTGYVDQYVFVMILGFLLVVSCVKFFYFSSIYSQLYVYVININIEKSYCDRHRAWPPAPDADCDAPDVDEDQAAVSLRQAIFVMVHVVVEFDELQDPEARRRVECLVEALRIIVNAGAKRRGLAKLQNSEAWRQAIFVIVGAAGGFNELQDPEFRRQTERLVELQDSEAWRKALLDIAELELQDPEALRQALLVIAKGEDSEAWRQTLFVIAGGGGIAEFQDPEVWKQVLFFIAEALAVEEKEQKHSKLKFIGKAKFEARETSRQCLNKLQAGLTRRISGRDAVDNLANAFVVNVGVNKADKTCQIYDNSVNIFWSQKKRFAEFNFDVIQKQAKFRFSVSEAAISIQSNCFTKIKAIQQRIENRTQENHIPEVYNWDSDFLFQHPIFAKHHRNKESWSSCFVGDWRWLQD